jgi:hypothetical protein
VDVWDLVLVRDGTGTERGRAELRLSGYADENSCWWSDQVSADADDVALPALQLTTSRRTPTSAAAVASAREEAQRRSVEADFTAFVAENYRRLLQMADLLTGDHPDVHPVIKSDDLTTWVAIAA